MSITYFSILYTYRFTRSSVPELCSFTSNRVNRYFTPLRCVLAPFHFSPFIAPSLSHFHSKRSHLPAASSSITLRSLSLIQASSFHSPFLVEIATIFSCYYNVSLIIFLYYYNIDNFIYIELSLYISYNNKEVTL